MFSHNLILNDHDHEQVIISQLNNTIETLINRLAEHKRHLTQYQQYLSYPDSKGFHSLVRGRMISTQSIIEADNLLLIEEIKKVDLALLIKMAINDPIFDKYCHHPVLDEYWNERWRLSGRNPSEKAAINQNPIHEYKPQSTLHTFELLKGIYFYSKYCQELNNEETLAESYLQLAAHFRNYAALNVLYRRHFKEPEEQDKAFSIAQMAADCYWTPGYILLALLSYQQERYQDALFHLIVAELLTPHSENMINNAYQGKSLNDVLQPLLNTLEEKSITQLKIHLAELAKLPTYFVTKNLYEQAHVKVNKLLHSEEKPRLSPPVTLNLRACEGDNGAALKCTL